MYSACLIGIPPAAYPAAVHLQSRYVYFLFFCCCHLYAFFISAHSIVFKNNCICLSFFPVIYGEPRIAAEVYVIFCGYEPVVVGVFGILVEIVFVDCPVFCIYVEIRGMYPIFRSGMEELLDFTVRRYV